VRRLLLCVVVCACSNSSPPAHPDAAVDARVDATSIMDAPFPCSSAMSCDKTTQYCYVLSVGALPAALPQPAGCTALPPSCGSMATCACITPTITDCSVGGGLTCEEHDGEVTATCNLP
jgi:hypothetical protein